MQIGDARRDRGGQRTHVAPLHGPRLKLTAEVLRNPSPTLTFVSSAPPWSTSRVSHHNAVGAVVRVLEDPYNWKDT